MHALTIQTSRRTELVDITDRVQEMLRTARLNEGVCTVLVPHTTPREKPRSLSKEFR